MRILLINPPDIDRIVADMSDYFDESIGAYPPMGLLYIASFLRESRDDEISIIDANLEGLDYHEIKNRIRTLNPDVVGITTLTFNLLCVLKITSDIKDIDSNIVTVLGGPHVTIYPEETMTFPYVDFVVLGEGEKVFQSLLDTIEGDRVFEKVDSIAFKNNGNIFVNSRSQFINDLDVLPFPSVDLIDIKKYFTVISSGKRTMVMMSSRGCPFNCIYCDRPHLGKNFRSRSAENVVNEIEVYITRYGINDIKFFDDTFTVNRKRVINICNEITKRNLSISWGVRARVNTVDEELLQIMYESGLRSISFGIESGNQAILNNLQKGITIEQVVKAVKNCRKLGIEILGDFILGNPGEKKEEINQTIRFAGKLKLDYAQFTIMTPFPSTQLYEMGLEKKIIKNDYWKEFAKNPRKDFITPVWEEFYSKEELVGYLKKAYRSFYFRPGYIINRLRKIKSCNEFLKKIGVFFSLLLLSFLPKGRLTKNFKQTDNIKDD